MVTKELQAGRANAAALVARALAPCWPALPALRRGSGVRCPSALGRALPGTRGRALHRAPLVLGPPRVVGVAERAEASVHEPQGQGQVRSEDRPGGQRLREEAAEHALGALE